MSAVLTVAGYALRECIRRRVFAVVLVLTGAFLALYALAASEAFKFVDEVGASDGDFGVDDQVLTGSTLLGLAMFTTLFLGCVLAVFLTLGAVRGDAERGLLQPLVVRPVGRTALLAGRFLAAGGVCALYVAAVYTAAVLITGAAGDWWPDNVVAPGLALAVGVLVIAALSLLGSIFLSANANGIAIFMVFGAGLAAGLLGQIGEGLSVQSLEDVARVTSWALPFEALYQGALHALTADVQGTTGVIVQLGPFGGAQESGPLLWLWSAAYLALVGAAARAAFARRDL
jgi:ABC-type transport system involved in multi-copper enzyme maturation permease subunit